MIEVNALDYGLVASVNTAAQAAMNAQAISAAFAAAPRVYLPDGQTFYTQQITPLVSAKKLFGNATLVMAGTGPGAGSALLSLGDVSDFVCEDLVIQVDQMAYPGIGGVILGGTTGVELRRVTASGSYGIGSVGTIADTLIERCRVPTYTLRGIDFPASVAGIKVRDCRVFGGVAGSQQGINVSGDDIEIAGCTVSGTIGFGICIEESTHFAIHNNYTISTLIEGINVTNSTWGQIRGNKCICFGSTDFGLSLSGQNGGQVGQVIIEGNIVDYAGKTSIALAGNVQWCKVIGNSLLSPFEDENGRAQFANLAAAVVLYGSPCMFNEVSENLIRDLDGHMQWQVAEMNFSGLGAPDYNKLGPHRGIPGTLGGARVIGPHSQIFI